MSLRCFKATGLAVSAFVVFVCLAHPAAAQRCKLVSATHSASSHAAALKASQDLAVQNARQLQQQYGWRSFSMRPRRVKGDTFWKAVRPKVPPEAVVGRPVVTGRTYSTCWTGVVVPYVCTSGSVVCGR